MTRLPLFSSFAFALFAFAGADARAADCFPACRAGYVCNPTDGRCVSECNPPCDGGTTCHAGQCIGSSVPKTTTTSATMSSAKRNSNEDSGTDAGEDNSGHHFAALGGGTMFVAKESAPGLATAFRWSTLGNHAFVVGSRFAVGMPEGTDFGLAGIDAGYRGNFARGDLKAGLVALAMPQVWFGGDAAMFHVGAAVGPFVHAGRLYVELPIGAGLATLLSDPFQGRSRDVGAVISVNALAGITF